MCCSKRKISYDFGFISLPTLKREENEYVWFGLEIRFINDLIGNGLYATKSLPKGLKIPYGGVRIDLETFAKMKKNPRRETTGISYCVDMETYHVDGNPLHLVNQQKPKYSWPGIYANYIDNEDDENAEIIIDTRNVIQYPNCTENLFLELTRDIKKGEQILIDYKYSSACQRHAGYGPDSKKCSEKSKTVWTRRKLMSKHLKDLEKCSHMNEVNHFSKK